MKPTHSTAYTRFPSSWALACSNAADRLTDCGKSFIAFFTRLRAAAKCLTTERGSKHLTLSGMFTAGLMGLETGLAGGIGQEEVRA